MYRDTANDRQTGETLAAGLGWFSLALGVAELTAPQSVARLIGVPPTERTLNTLRAYGAREVGAGLAILAQPDRSTWLWSRVAGDALDLATLGAAMRSPSTDKGRVMFATAAVLGVTALDVICARQLSEQEEDDRTEGFYDDRRAASTQLRPRHDTRVLVSEAITINESMERVEERWSNLESLPESLRLCGRETDGGPERAIVEFRHAPGGRGTEVRVELEYQPRGGRIGAALAKLVGGDPTGQVRQDLKRFKQLVETGEITLSDGPALWRPGRPAENVEEIRRASGLGVS